MTNTPDTSKLDGANLETFEQFLATYGRDGELGRELTKCLATAVKATNAYGGKSTFTVRFTVEQVDEGLWGDLSIVPTITEKPARASRVSHYRTDQVTGQISLL